MLLKSTEAETGKPCRIFLVQLAEPLPQAVITPFTPLQPLTVLLSPAARAKLSIWLLVAGVEARKVTLLLVVALVVLVVIAVQ
jgi:hypothetical protein